jgi:lipopolysaccharide export system protein LptC
MHSQAYTRYIKMLRLVLPTLAAIGLLTLLLWPWWRERQQTLLSGAIIPPVSTSPTPAAKAPLQVLKPEYQGTDKSGRPYRITADRVEQALDPKDPLLLIAPRASLVFDAAKTDHTGEATLQAQQGLYDQQAQTIDLQGNVIFAYGGYQLHAADLALDLIAGAATTATPVTGDGPAGSIAGQALSIADKGARIVLKGPSRVVLHPVSSTEPAATP